MELAYKIILFMLLAGSVYTDLRWRLIKNVIVFPSIITGLVLRYIDAGLPGVGLGLKGLLFGFLMIFIPYMLIGGLGEGDVKLMAAVGVLTGPYFVIWAALLASLYGALISIMVMAREKRLKDAMTFTLNYSSFVAFKLARGDFSQAEVQDTGTTIAYAVPIALGVLSAGFYLGW